MKQTIDQILNFYKNNRLVYKGLVQDANNISGIMPFVGDALSKFAFGSRDDFINEVSELKDIYNYMINKYDKFKEDNPIKAASHSYVSKRGINALDKIANAYKKVLDESVTEDNKVLDKENLSYDYMLCGEDVTASYAEYQTAIAWIKDAQKTTKSK